MSCLVFSSRFPLSYCSFPSIPFAMPTNIVHGSVIKKKKNDTEKMNDLSTIEQTVYYLPHMSYIRSGYTRPSYIIISKFGFDGFIRSSQPAARDGNPRLAHRNATPLQPTSSGGGILGLRLIQPAPRTRPPTHPQGTAGTTPTLPPPYLSPYFILPRPTGKSMSTHPKHQRAAATLRARI